jgi:chromosome segregation ATPase
MTKQDQINLLTAQLAEANVAITEQTYKIESLEEKIEARDKKIKELHKEIDGLIHTPEFAADTEAAFNRGRQEGVRSLASTANNYLFAMAEDTVSNMNRIVNKYTRELTSNLFLGTVLEEDVISDLPDTDFAKDLVAGLNKVDVVGFTHTHTE